MTESEIDEEVKENREYYAKMALLMIYLFQTLEDLKTDGSYWKKFEGQLQMYSEEQKKSEQKKNKKKKQTIPLQTQIIEWIICLNFLKRLSRNS